jgi:hypothetical protein
MRVIGHHPVFPAVVAFALAFFPLAGHASDPFKPISKEELSMTQVPGYPGAAAVVLYREENDLAEMHVQQRYERVKILTEKGKDLANVELTFSNFDDPSYFYEESEDRQVTDIVGRTIHADGTVIPFTGKPYLKTIAKGANFKYQAKVFTLPDVEVGSIIEYRYSERIADHYYEAPRWYIQGKYFVKAAHYTWSSPTHFLVDSSSGAMISNISWFPILPVGVTVEHHEVPGTRTGEDLPANLFEVHVKDVPPSPQEEFMPPIGSFTYRVLFNLSEYGSADDYWKSNGKDFAKRVDGFADGGGGLRNVAESIDAGAATSEDRLRKLYDAVQQLENTDYTREHGATEDKASGLGKVRNAKDVLDHKRGDSQELTMLFLGLARSEKFKAYAMMVPDRTHDLFTPSWLNMGQFGAMVVIVNVDGKEKIFDPGSRYTPFGHLAWQHTFVQGLREVDGGTALDSTSGDGYSINRIARVANLTMADDGQVSGRISFTFAGSPAVEWRERALRGDQESLQHSLRKDLEDMLPRSLEVTLEGIGNLTDYEKPLVVNYSVKGPIAAVTGKRLVLPADLFVANKSATFPQEKRELTVYFHYAYTTQDAVKINFPALMSVEAAPDSTKENFMKRGQYDISIVSTASSFTTRRNYIFGEIAVSSKDYPELRSFYSKFEAKDKEPIVLKVSASANPTTASTAGSGGTE